MSIAKPFTFVANTYAKASEVNANFDTVYSQVNTNISGIAQNATDIDNLENNKADINGNSAQRFAVADAIANGDAINKQTLLKSIGNSIGLISGFVITKDSGSPEDTIIVSDGSTYDSTKTAVLILSSSVSKQNTNQAANATYYVYVIGNSTGSSVDVLISTSSTTPALPSGYSLYRQIGNYTTDANNKINIISSYGIPIDSKINTLYVPDYTSGITTNIPISGTQYICPSNGIISIALASRFGVNAYLKINNITIFDITANNATENSSEYTGTFPVLANDVINAKNGGNIGSISNAHYITFYPYKGV